MAHRNELQHAHESLLNNALHLQEHVRTSCSNADLQAEIERFEHDLDAHLALEETGGYFAAVTALHPEFDRRVRRLFAQHAEFRHAWRTLPSVGSSALAERVDTLIDALRDHEARERNLLQDVYMQDLGTGD